MVNIVLTLHVVCLCAGSQMFQAQQQMDRKLQLLNDQSAKPSVAGTPERARPGTAGPNANPAAAADANGASAMPRTGDGPAAGAAGAGRSEDDRRDSGDIGGQAAEAGVEQAGAEDDLEALDRQQQAVWRPPQSLYIVQEHVVRGRDSHPCHCSSRYISGRMPAECA